jgi:serine/threonine protein kinase
MQGPSDDRSGQLIGGKYFIDGLLARGGMGLIYAARHSGTGRSVAVKILRPELAGRSDLVRRVSAEARLAVEASHPNVVEVLDAGADDAGIPYVVLERLNGRALDAFIESPIELVPTVQALLPILNALVSLHQAGIVHRDIKPSNIFLSRLRDGRITPKLLDFGIAKALSSADSALSSVGLGTPSYMAPEQALGCVALGPATDVWSMAVVLVRCLTGCLPFADVREKGPSVSSFAFDVAGADHVPRSITSVLSRALQLDPRDRFANMAEFRSALLSALPPAADGVRWPSEDTVAYSTQEFALAELPCLRDSLLDASGSGNNSRAARPADMLTRTLSKAWQAANRGRWQPVALATSLGLVGATVLYLSTATPEGQSTVSVSQASLSIPTPEHALPAHGDLAVTMAVDSLHASTGAPSASSRGLESQAASAPAIAGASGPAATQPKPQRAQASSLQIKSEPSEAAQAGVTLGPNRSPIIE